MSTIKIQLFVCIIMEIMLAQVIPPGPHTQVGAFVYVETLLGWNDAQSYCMNVFETSLATIITVADNNLLTSRCNPPIDPNDGISCPSDQNGGASGANNYNCGCWIGLFRESGTQDNATGPWQWADGCTEYDLRIWAPGGGGGQPDNRNGYQECVSIFKNFGVNPDGSWNDRPCNGTSGGLASQYFFCNSPASILCSDNPTTNPSQFPSQFPSKNPSQFPSKHPTNNPSSIPTIQSTSPTNSPTCDCDSFDSNSASDDDLILAAETEQYGLNKQINNANHTFNHEMMDKIDTNSIQISLSESAKIQIILLFVAIVIFANVMCCWLKNK